MPVQPFGKADPYYDALRVMSNQNIQGAALGDTGAGGVLENKIYVWHADGSTLDTFAPTEAGLNAAIAVVVSGDTIWLPSIVITMTAAITLPANVTIVGISGQAQLSFGSLGSAAITLSASSVLDRVFVTQSANDAVDLILVQGPSSGTGYIGHCALSCAQSGSGDATALLGGAGVMRAQECGIVAQTVSGTPLAASATANTIYLDYCDVSAVKNGSDVIPFSTSTETLLDTFSVAANNSAYQGGSYSTTIGVTYRVEVSGTASYDNAPNPPDPNKRVDADYSTLDNWVTPLFANHFQFSDGSQPIADEASYQSSHVYNYTRAGTGAVFAARIVYANYPLNTGSLTVNVYSLTGSTINLIACKLNGAWLSIPEWSDRSAWDTATYPDRHAKDIDDGSFTYHNDPANPTGASHISEVVPSAFPDNTEVTTDSIVIHADGTDRDINLLPTGTGQVAIIGGRGIGFLPQALGPDFGTNIGGMQYRTPIESMAKNFFLFRGGQYVFETEGADWMFIITPTGVNVGSLADNVLVPLSKFEVNGNAAIGAAYVRAAAAPTNGLIVQGNVGIGNNNPTEPLLVTGNIKSTTKVTAKPTTAGIELDPNAATGNFTHSLSPTNLTANRRATFQNADGTVAYLSDIPTAGHTIQDEGTPLTQRANLNFAGTGVTVTDDAGNSATVVTIPQTIGAVSIYNETQSADGTSTIYYLANYAAPSTIRVYIDGIRQPASDDTDPTDVVTFDVAPDAGATLLFDYEMDIA